MCVNPLLFRFSVFDLYIKKGDSFLNIAIWTHSHIYFDLVDVGWSLGTCSPQVILR